MSPEPHRPTPAYNLSPPAQTALRILNFVCWCLNGHAFLNSFLTPTQPYDPPLRSRNSRLTGFEVDKISVRLHFPFRVQLEKLLHPPKFLITTGIRWRKKADYKPKYFSVKISINLHFSIVSRQNLPLPPPLPSPPNVVSVSLQCSERI